MHIKTADYVSDLFASRKQDEEVQQQQLPPESIELDTRVCEFAHEIQDRKGSTMIICSLLTSIIRTRFSLASEFHADHRHHRCCFPSAARQTQILFNTSG